MTREQKTREWHQLARSHTTTVLTKNRWLQRLPSIIIATMLGIGIEISALPRPSKAAASFRSMVVPAIAVDHGTPLILSASRRQIVVEHQQGSDWQRQVVAAVSSQDTVTATSLICQSQGCIAAVVVASSLPRPSAHIWVFRPQNFNSKLLWTHVTTMTVPSYLVGHVYLALAGRYAWLMATTTPALGQMPKILWASHDRGVRWRLLATGSLPSLAADQEFPAPDYLPFGYPDGMVGNTHGTLTVATSPRGGDIKLETVYQMNRPGVQVLTFNVPPAFRPIYEGFPALYGRSQVEIPLLESHHGHAYLALASRRNESTHWSMYQWGPTISGPSVIFTGKDTDILVGLKTLQIVSLNRQVIQLPIVSAFQMPLVAAAIAPGKIIVLGHGQTFWVNTNRGLWRQWRPV